jgi:hypothetical protein
MKNCTMKRKKTAGLLVIIGMIVAGCAAQTTTTTKSYNENRRFVPRAQVANDTFGVTSSQYMGCSYDQLLDGYWCPANR